MLTVVCWKWRGWRAIYEPRHVHALKRMVEQHLHMPHRFVCITDDADGLECETVPLWDSPVEHVRSGYPNCFVRLGVFSIEARELLGERVLSIDLDCVILDDITDLIGDDDLKIMAGSVCPYNGSLFLHRTGTRSWLWDEIAADPISSLQAVRRHARKTRRDYYGSDQAWIAYRCPDEPTWTEADGVYQYRRLGARPLPDDARIVFFAGPEKPWGVHERRPDLARFYSEFARMN